MQRYFLEEAYQPKERYEVQGEGYHHMVRVMRMASGRQVYLVFTNQTTIIAEIIEISEHSVYLKEIGKEQQAKELPIQVTIASGYPKGDKLEFIAQKVTELGAHQFVGFPAQASVVKWDDKKLQKKQQRLEKIAQEAAEQSHRQVTPTITLFSSSQAFYQTLTQYDAILVAYEESAKQGEQSQLVQTLKRLPLGATLLVIFGPEGGLSQKEVTTLEAAGARLCGLGPRILRCETAPLYLLSAVSYRFELQ